MEVAAKRQETTSANDIMPFKKQVLVLDKQTSATDTTPYTMQMSNVFLNAIAFLELGPVSRSVIHGFSL